MALRCVYTDLDGTLLGRGASLFRDAEGGFTLLPSRALEACHRAGVEVVLKSGRRKVQVMEDARLIGAGAYAYEIGAGLVVDGEETLLTGDLRPDGDTTIYELIERSGAPRLLLETFAGRLEHHSPWHLGREISHVMRGLVNLGEANALLDDAGYANLRLVDNGPIAPRDTLGGLEGPPHVYHLLPREASKAKAVALHRRMRGYEPEECIAVGDSREDLGVAESVGRFFLVANGLEKDPSVRDILARLDNVTVTEARNGDGFYEAVVRSLAEIR